MNRKELERAWPAAEPPAGFAERVVERLQLDAASPQPARRGAGGLVWLRVNRLRWLALPAVALALAGLLLLWPVGPDRERELFAAEPRVVSIGERVVAEVSSGAHLRWSNEGLPGEVQQDVGDVTYRVQPGAAFRVQTPHGRVDVLGTVFRVVVAEGEEAKGEPMKKRWAVAGASATLGALLWVSVDRGSVRLSQNREELVLRAGQAGAIGADGVPHRESHAPSVVEDAGGAGNRDAERARNRQVADAVRRHAARRRAAALAASAQPPPSGPTTPPIEFGPHPPAPPVEFVLPNPDAPPPPPPPPPTEEDVRRREYLRRTMREQYFPVARECYAELLERKPAAAGKIVLEFAIVGDGDAGVLDRVELREDKDTIDDAEFQLCMRESLYTAVFEPPPPGASETTVVYPVMLSPE